MLVRGGREVFGLRVTGDSMIEAGILSGDYIFVRKQATADRGDIVVALIGDEATVKYYYPGARLRALPARQRADGADPGARDRFQVHDAARQGRRRLPPALSCHRRAPCRASRMHGIAQVATARVSARGSNACGPCPMSLREGQIRPWLTETSPDC